MLTALLVDDVQKSYGQARVLRGISFAVEPGHIFALLGPNGAGKTTTLECILGLRRPDAGSITVLGIDALAHPQQVKPLVGAQLQSTALQQKITPRQAVQLFGSFYPRAIPPAHLLEQFDLTAKADAAFDTLSGGQQQRLALALAFVNDPRIVLLDEPTAGLDPLARRQLHGMIRAARAAGRTVILSTHDLDEAEHLADAVAIIDAGTVVAAGAPRQLIAAASAPLRIRICTARPSTDAELVSLPHVSANRRLAPNTFELDTSDINGTLVAAMQLLQSQHNDLVDVQIRRPSLEDVYVENARRGWPSPATSM